MFIGMAQVLHGTSDNCSGKHKIMRRSPIHEEIYAQAEYISIK